MKVGRLKKILADVPNNLDVTINTMRHHPMINEDGFKIGSVTVVEPSGLWPRGLWIDIKEGFRY